MKLSWYCWGLLGIGGTYAILKLASDRDSADANDEDESFFGLIRTVETIFDLAQSLATGDRRLTSARKNSAGVVLDSPDELVTAATELLGRPVDKDRYSLARALRSEGGNESDQSKGYRASVILNQAKSRGLSVTQLALLHTNPARDGHYGKQIGGAFATTQDPFESDLFVAESADPSADTTGGAIQFSDRDSFGVQEGTSNWSEHVAQRQSEGKIGAILPGARSGLVFWYRGFLPSFATRIS
jgi:hypothetical protein